VTLLCKDKQTKLQELNGILMCSQVTGYPLKKWHPFVGQANRRSGETKFQKLVTTLPRSAAEFFQGLLEEQPEHRLTAVQAVNHPFLLEMRL